MLLCREVTVFAYKMVFSPGVEKIIVFASKTFTYRSVKFRFR